MEVNEINMEHAQPIIDCIKANPIFSFVDIFVFYKGCCKATAYNHNLDKLDDIKEAIYANKRRGVTTMLSKWLKSENATLQISAFKILCDSDEHRRLQQNYTDISGTILNSSPLSLDELKQAREQLNNEL